jgi:phosphoglycerate dehydrogenase-like enzyme
MTRVAVLDDWQGIAERCADWSGVRAKAELAFFRDAFADEDAAAAALADFEVLVAMRERTEFPASLIDRLPKLRMISQTGGRARTLDIAACTTRGVLVCNTGGGAQYATAELALGLMLAAFRHIPAADAGIRAGRFQDGIVPGIALEGRTLGVIGLGRLGGRMARYGQALGMRVLAWSANLTEARAREGGAERVEKDRLLAESDAVSLHLVLSDRTRGVLGARELGLMKPGAVLVNTSRGPLVDEAALLAALHAGRIIAALDVFDREPLPAEHPLRHAPNTVLTPHLGYNTEDTFARFYRESVENVVGFLEGRPVRAVNPEALR